MGESEPAGWRRFLPHLSGTSRNGIVPDLAAGLTVAALSVPQGMAFALIAGVPVQLGLLAGAIPALVGALFGSSRYLVTGPTNANALVIGVSVVGPVVAAGGAVPIDAVLGTALLAGLMLVSFGLAGLGRASRFLSDSVLAGFACGVGILTALRQIPAAAGVTAPLSQPPSSLAPSIWSAVLDTLQALRGADERALLLAFATPALMMALRRFDQRIPGALLALAAATATSVFLGWETGPDPVPSLGALPSSWLVLHMPSLPDPRALVGPALAIALLSTVQSVAAARAVSEGERLDSDRELFAQGAANIAASAVGALPTSGSLSRSALGRACGARSRLAAAVSGLAVALVLPAIAPYVSRVPLPALAGLVVLAGSDLVNPRALRRAAATRGDALVLAATLGATLWIDLVQAVYVGLFLSLALLVRRSGRLQIVEIVSSGPERFRELAIDEKTGTTPAVMLHLEGDLNFAVAPELADLLGEIGARRPRVLILRLKRARHLDATVLEVLRWRFGELRGRGTRVLLCGLTDSVAELLERTELAEVLGSEGLLRAGARLFEGFERAVQRTRAELRPLSDDEIFRTDVRPPWSYEI